MIPREATAGPNAQGRDAVQRIALTHDDSDTNAARLMAEELSLLIDGATDYAIYMLDPDGLVTIWNRGAERIKGWRSTEIIGQHFALFYPSEEIARGQPQRDLDRADAEGRVVGESWRIRKDGSEFLAGVTLTALRDAAGTLRGFGKVVRDITDQKAAQTALSRREHHLTSILETVPDAMIVIDEAGMVVSFSAAAERLFGHASDTVIGRNVRMLMPEPDRHQHNAYLDAYRATGQRKVIGQHRVVTAQHRNGDTFPVELSVGETLSGGQRIFTGFLRDLTQRHRVERELQKLQADVLHVSRLSAMGTMASTLAHELNQPLTAIANYLETTRDMLIASDDGIIALVREALDEAAAQALRAGEIVRRLREFVAHGVVQSRIEPLGALVRDAAGLGLIDAPQLGIRATISLCDGDDRVFVDRVQIQQVLVNLIRNAVQSLIDVERRDLTISTVRHAPGWMRVIVSDTGRGLDPMMSDRLFQAFVSTKAEGMGLGLSICRTIIEAHGGQIWMSPVEGGGCTFHFTLACPQETEGG